MISVFSLGGFSMNMSGDEKDYKQKLIASVKKEVKQVMEESVTRKFVHEESGSVTSLCGAVENCLSQGLRRRALGLFKTSSTTALLHKIAKHCPEADRISQKVQELENVNVNRRSSSSSDSRMEAMSEEADDGLLALRLDPFPADDRGKVEKPLVWKCDVAPAAE
ncbi:hypothetical protein HUJ04_001273 [Dendroctonus ponderosae]|nr:hypothetical protein HUJ04_001273 [Dendroctonus ponderosae]